MLCVKYVTCMLNSMSNFHQSIFILATSVNLSSVLATVNSSLISSELEMIVTLMVADNRHAPTDTSKMSS